MNCCVPLGQQDRDKQHNSRCHWHHKQPQETIHTEASLIAIFLRIHPMKMTGGVPSSESSPQRTFSSIPPPASRSDYARRIDNHHRMGHSNALLRISITNRQNEWLHPTICTGVRARTTLTREPATVSPVISPRRIGVRPGPGSRVGGTPHTPQYRSSLGGSAIAATVAAAAA